MTARGLGLCNLPQEPICVVSLPKEYTRFTWEYGVKMIPQYCYDNDNNNDNGNDNNINDDYDSNDNNNDTNIDINDHSDTTT